MFTEAADMHLGALLKRVAEGGEEADTIEALGDLALYARVELMSSTFGETTGEYIRNAAGRFAARAGDEAWMSLVTAVEKSASPQQAAIGEIVGWALERDRAELAREAQGQCGCGNVGCNST
jgi:HEAT repeat protein